MQFRNIVAAGLLALGAVGTIAAVQASSDDEPRGEHTVIKHRMRGGHGSLEFVAMHNVMAELLSAKTGRTQAEIRALFDKGGPRAAFDELGLAEEDVRPLFKQARGTVIDRAVAANLITAEQAEKLRQAKVELRHKRRHRGGEHGPDHE